METITTDVLFSLILNDPPTHVLFLVNKYYNTLQKTYYEYLGCSDGGSKYFMHCMMKLRNTHPFESVLHKLNCMNFCFEAVKFSTDALSQRMNSYLELLVDFFNVSHIGDNNSSIKTQVVLLMACSAVGKNCLNSVSRMLILYLLKFTGNKESAIQTIDLNYLNDDTIAEIKYSVTVVNIFNSMIGVKRSYSLSTIDTEYTICDMCFEDRMCYCDQCSKISHVCEPVSRVRRSFIVTPRVHSGSGDYFYYPKWYDKMYSRLNNI